MRTFIKNPLDQIKKSASFLRLIFLIRYKTKYSYIYYSLAISPYPKISSNWVSPILKPSSNPISSILFMTS